MSFYNKDRSCITEVAYTLQKSPRYVISLDTYDFQLIHQKGAKHFNADALSRQVHRKCPRSVWPECRPSLVCPVNPQPADIVDDWLTTWPGEELKQWQREDPVLSRVNAMVGKVSR